MTLSKKLRSIAEDRIQRMALLNEMTLMLSDWRGGPESFSRALDICSPDNEALEDQLFELMIRECDRQIAGYESPRSARSAEYSSGEVKLDLVEQVQRNLEAQQRRRRFALLHGQKGE